jgi:hypothetical protein
MKKTDVKREINILIDKLTKDDLLKAKTLIEEIIVESKIPYDDEPLEEEDLQALQGARREAAEGKLMPLERVMKKHGV